MSTSRCTPRWRPGYFWISGTERELFEVLGPGYKRGLKSLQRRRFPYCGRLDPLSIDSQMDTSSRHWARWWGQPLPEAMQPRIRELLNTIANDAEKQEVRWSAAKALRGLLSGT